MAFSFNLGGFGISFGKRSYEIPEAYTPVDGPASYSFSPATGMDIELERAISSLNGSQNLLNLAECVPEIFAPVHEIALRVADCVWQLKRDIDDEIIYDNVDFNRLFTKPNPTQSIKQLIYEAVFYEILTGKEYFYANAPRATEALGSFYKNTASWFNFPSQNVKVNYVNPLSLYTATSLQDIVSTFELNGVKYDTDRVLPIHSLNLRNKHCPLEGRSALVSAKKAISNLIAVYEARGVIYVKRGMLGLIVSKKTDASGTVALTPNEKAAIRTEMNKDYGLTGGRDLTGVSNVPVEYVDMAMSIRDLQPFDETYADAVAIYAVLGVPKHLVPSKDNSTFANADADLKKFYTSIIIPKAKQYAEALTTFFRFDQEKKYIDVDYSHIELLQADRLAMANTFGKNVETYAKLYDANLITKNQFLIGINEDQIEGGDVYKNDVKNNEPLAVQLGVGGTQALQAIIADPNINEEAKKNIVILLFGITPADAAKIVGKNQDVKEDPLPNIF